MTVVVAAAATLTKILTVNETKTGIGRVKAFNPDSMQDNIPLTLYLKNVPVLKENDNDPYPQRYGVTVPEVIALFKEYGAVTLVRFRYGSEKTIQNKSMNYPKKSFPLGSAFVEFETAEMQTKAAAELCKSEGDDEPKKQVQLKGQILIIRPLKEWLADKEKKNVKMNGNRDTNGKRSHEVISEKDKEESVTTDKDKDNTTME